MSRQAIVELYEPLNGDESLKVDLTIRQPSHRITHWWLHTGWFFFLHLIYLRSHLLSPNAPVHGKSETLMKGRGFDASPSPPLGRLAVSHCSQRPPSPFNEAAMALGGDSTCGSRDEQLILPPWMKSGTMVTSESWFVSPLTSRHGTMWIDVEEVKGESEGFFFLGGLVFGKFLDLLLIKIDRRTERESAQSTCSFQHFDINYVIANIPYVHLFSLFGAAVSLSSASSLRTETDRSTGECVPVSTTSTHSYILH